MTTEIKVTVADVRAVHFCARGARAWFARHDLNYTEFVTQGVPISQIEALGDALGLKAAEHARKVAAGGAA